jgi:hypothetical protein
MSHLRTTHTPVPTLPRRSRKIIQSGICALIPRFYQHIPDPAFFLLLIDPRCKGNILLASVANFHTFLPNFPTHLLQQDHNTCPRIPMNAPIEARCHFDQHHKNCTCPSLTNNFLTKTKLFLFTEISCNTPKQCFQSTTRPLTRTQYQKISNKSPFHTITPDVVLKTLRKTKRGTAPGPFCDQIDPLRDFATFRPQPTDTDQATANPHSSAYPYLVHFTALLQLILDGNLPLACHATFNCNYFLALHKDPNDLRKLRPIGIRSALRRITAALAITVLSGDAAQFFLPKDN